ncbi:MAG: hypothetical protein R3279_02795 [Putridiphycobacter sp.]|nr:hypothetical protein [Putridiphycobacter sp.]
MPFNRVDGDFIEIRPRFKLKTVLSKEQVLNNLLSGLSEDRTVLGKTVIDVFYLDIPKVAQKYWSPELRASVEKNEAEDGSIIRVVIGPRYKVWVLFIFLYTFLGLVCLFGGMYGMAQWNLGIESLWIYCFPIMLVLIATLYVVAKLGQRATRDEMLHLTSYLYHHIQDEELERIG